MDTNDVEPFRYDCTETECFGITEQMLYDEFYTHRKKMHPELKKKKVFLCVFCTSILASSGSLKNHVDAVHINKQEFKCAHCLFTTNRKSTFDDHSNSRHREEETPEINESLDSFIEKKAVAPVDVHHSAGVEEDIELQRAVQSIILKSIEGPDLAGSHCRKRNKSTELESSSGPIKEETCPPPEKKKKE